MRRLDIATAVIMLALSAIVIAGLSGYAFWLDYAPGPAFAPYLIAGSGIFLSLLLLVAALRGGQESADWPDAFGGRRVAYTVIALILFVAALPFLGFAFSGIVFMLVLLLLVLRRRMVPSLATTAITVALVQGIFVQWLSVKLPTGPWGF
jgi:putative tricarboxylic transport membrane protein